MIIETAEKENSLLISISGSIEVSRIRELSERVDMLCVSSDRDIEVDLSAADYIDSTGISLLLKLNKSQKLKGHNFCIVRASDKVASLLNLCSLHDTLIK